MSKTTKTTRQTAEKRERKVLSARQRTEAVLAVWSERRRPSEVCKELGVQWASLNNWQTRAMEAVLAVLEPRTRKEEERGPALSPSMEKLLQKTQQRTARLSKLEKRLEKIQKSREGKASQTE